MLRNRFAGVGTAALVATMGLLGAGPAMAADLGGDCCADLEERVAELEATTVRKGNRKVSLTLSGYVAEQLMYWNDGTQKDNHVGDGANMGSRFRFVGSAKISAQLSAGFLYEFNAFANSLGSINQLNGGGGQGNTGAPQSASLGGTAYQGCGNAVGASTINSTNSVGCPIIRQATVYLKHEQLGMVRIGHGSTATDDLIVIDIAGLDSAATPDVGLFLGGFILRGKNGTLGSATSVNWLGAIRGHESFDTFRRDNVFYQSPTLMGFNVQAAIGNDNFWDVALRYAGEAGGFRFAGGIGYTQDTGFNGAFQNLNQAGVLCTTNCDTKVSDFKGSASLMHVPTGLFIDGAAGNRVLQSTTGGAGANQVYTGPDLRFWWLAAGVSKNYFGLGSTVLLGEYGEHKGGLAQTNFLSGTTNYATNVDSTVTQWGFSAVQHIDAAAMEVFASFKNLSLKGDGFNAANAALNSSNGGVHDIQAVVVGSRIRF